MAISEAGLGGVSPFPSAYYDEASKCFPQDVYHAFDWCRYLYLANGVLRAATLRTVAYFITDLVYKSDTENTGRLKKILEDPDGLDTRSMLMIEGVNYAVYGNAVSAIYFPFVRQLYCPECDLARPSNMVQFKYTDGKFVGDCACGARNVKFFAMEMKRLKASDINIINLEPQALKIKKHPMSRKIEYYWELPNDYIQKVKVEQDNFFINDTPKEVLDALIKEKTFKFDKKYIHHIKAPTISGFSNSWGCPPYIHILKQNFYSTVLKKANEAIAMDFIMPFRTLSPGASSPNADPISTFSLGTFVSKMQEMVANHRLDPLNIQIAPMPINYQAFGAEKKALDVTAEIKFSIEEQLHSLNYPAELFFNTLQIQAMPAALRLFENTWSPLVNGLNSYLQWVANHICDFMGWGREEVTLARVTTADDIEKRQIGLQLASAQQISAITAQRAYGYDFEDEQRKILEQQKIQMEIQQEFQNEMQAQQQMSPEGAGGQPGQSTVDINTQAQQVAQEWLQQPEPMRVRAMRQMESANPTLYAVAKSVMEKIRTASKSEQGMENLQQMGLGGDAQQQPPQ